MSDPIQVEWKTEQHRRFAADMKAHGIAVCHYRGRYFYDGPAAETGGGIDLQDIIRATRVRVQTDNLGLDLIVYPA